MLGRTACHFRTLLSSSARYFFSRLSVMSQVGRRGLWNFLLTSNGQQVSDKVSSMSRKTLASLSQSRWWPTIFKLNGKYPLRAARPISSFPCWLQLSIAMASSTSCSLLRLLQSHTDESRGKARIRVCSHWEFHVLESGNPKRPHLSHSSQEEKCLWPLECLRLQAYGILLLTFSAQIFVLPCFLLSGALL